MLTRTSASAILAVAVVPAALLAPAASALGRAPRRALLTSRRLWATIDVCNPADQPDTVGIRGSMPGDGDAHDTMYMRFTLQVLDPATKRWGQLQGGVASEYIEVGGGSSSRQGGASFVIKPVAGKPAATLRGIVDFQWRHGHTVFAQAVRQTSAGRTSLAGADPAGFSAASCSIG